MLFKTGSIVLLNAKICCSFISYLVLNSLSLIVIFDYLIVINKCDVLIIFFYYNSMASIVD